jgi:hypothetical protein
MMYNSDKGKSGVVALLGQRQYRIARTGKTDASFR